MCLCSASRFHSLSFTALLLSHTWTSSLSLSCYHFQVTLDWSLGGSSSLISVCWSQRRVVGYLLSRVRTGSHWCVKIPHRWVWMSLTHSLNVTSQWGFFCPALIWTSRDPWAAAPVQEKIKCFCWSMILSVHSGKSSSVDLLKHKIVIYLKSWLNKFPPPTQLTELWTFPQIFDALWVKTLL